MDRDRAAKYLFEQVNENNVSKVEEMVKSRKLSVEIIRYEFYIPDLLETSLQQNKLAFKLLQCEINSLSSFHLAAMLGYTDIVVSLLDTNIAVDVTIESGTTALHLACFGGHIGTVKLLMNVYKAEVNRVDRYGWTALHYAATEGNIDIIKQLIQYGADINKRDKDGTCAALRAQWQGHADVVEYFCNIGEEDELLNIAESDGLQDSDPTYAKIKKSSSPSKTPDRSTTPTTQSMLTASLGIDEPNNNSKLPPRRSESTGLLRSKSAITSSKPQGMSKSATLPTHFKEARHSRIRRVIQKELEAAFSDYANPIQEGVGAASEQQQQDSEILMAGVGVNTMTKLMREEIQKYRDQILTPPPAAPGRGFNTGGAAIKEEGSDDEDYESLYDTLKDFGEAPAIPGAPAGGENGRGSVYNTYVPPPLPPRNQGDHINAADAEEEEDDDEVAQMFNSMSIKGQPTSEALNAAIRKLGQILGLDWKKLARALPIDKSASKTEDRIKRIEKQYLGNTEKQALQALLDWRLIKGRAAEVDVLILAMRRCGLHNKIEEMEKAACEFTA